jgi:Beta-propeller repeat
VDASGNSYVSGTTYSTDFPASGNLSPNHRNGDGFVFKLNAAGSALMYSIYLGGSAADSANGIALDSSGNAYVVGSTASADFPTMGAFQSSLSGGSDAFVTKINSTGTAFVYSTYLGGTKDEVGSAIAVNGTSAYVAGQTFSSDFPQARSLQAFAGGSDAFIAKLSDDGSSLAYSTFLGGSIGCCHVDTSQTYTAARGIAGDGNTSVLVAGDTNSSNFPVTSNPTGFSCCAGTSGYNSEMSFIAKLVDDLPTATWTRVEQDNAAVQYTGDWLTNTDPNHSGGSAALTMVNSVTFNFSGTGVRWIGYSDPWSGIANVYVDGVFKASVDTYSSTSKYQVLQYMVTGLASGNHTLKIQGTGQRSSAALSSWVWVDAFEWTSGGGPTGGNPDFSLTANPSAATVVQGGTASYTVSISAANGFAGTVSLSAGGFGSGASGSFSPPSISGSGSSTLTVTTAGAAQTGAFTLTITGSSGGLNHSATVTLNVNPGSGTPTWTRVEQNNAAAQYAGDWLTNTNPNHSGGSAALTMVNSVTFSFSGTGVRWIGYSDPWSGIADVYVDGVFQASVDTYSSMSKYQVMQYIATGLASGNHTLKIQGTGNHNPAASSSWVWVDAFEWLSSGGGSPDFTLTVTPTAATVVQGGGTTYTASVTAVSGFGGMVSLSASGFGSGASGSFNPPSITGSGSSTLTVTTTGTSQTGTFPLTITGSSGGLSHSATATLNVSPSGSGPTWTRVEQDNGAVQYTGDWFTNTDPSHSGGTAALTLVNSVTFSFSGTGVRWIGYSDPWSGIANVYLDGVFKESIDTYSSTSKYQVVQYTVTGLASGNHTLRIQGTGQRDSAALSSWVWVDAFEYAN